MQETAFHEDPIHIEMAEGDEPAHAVEVLDSVTLTAGSDNVMTREELDLQVRIYEQMYAMPSCTFYEKWLRGEMPDTYETNDWATLYEYQQRNYGS